VNCRALPESLDFLEPAKLEATNAGISLTDEPSRFHFTEAVKLGLLCFSRFYGSLEFLSKSFSKSTKQKNY